VMKEYMEPSVVALGKFNSLTGFGLGAAREGWWLIADVPFRPW